MSHSPKPGFVIECATQTDVIDIVQMVRELAEYERALDQCHVTATGLKKMLFGRKPAAEALVARQGDGLVGYAIFFENFSTWECKPGIYLEDLYVRPAARKQGIGRAMLAALAKIAVERDCARFEWAVLEWNELAKTQYRKLGAAPLDEWRVWRLTGKALKELAAETPAPFLEELIPEPPAPEPADAGKVVIYTDGGCRPNPGVGGWAAILSSGGKTKELSGGELDSTNNRMELLAAINALEALKKPCEVVMHTDSQYVKNGITSWVKGWKRNGWKSKTGPVKNVELWKRLDLAAARHKITWQWVRGHAGNVLNERCDEICEREIEKLS